MSPTRPLLHTNNMEETVDMIAAKGAARKIPAQKGGKSAVMVCGMTESGSSMSGPSNYVGRDSSEQHHECKEKHDDCAQHDRMMQCSTILKAQGPHRRVG